MSKILFFLTCESKLGFDLALEHEGNGDQITICLLQNAVYYANKTNSQLENCIRRGAKVYAGEEDVKKRGIKQHLHPEVKLLGYGEVIDLVLDQDNIVNL